MPSAAATAGNAAGAGGGAVGVLQIFTPMGVTPTVSGTTSPAFQPKKNAMVR